MTSKFDIVVGFSVNPDITWTDVPEFAPGQKVPARAKFHISGTSLNVAQAMKICGISRKLIGAVGQGDLVNAMIERYLREEGITYLLLEARESTPLAHFEPKTDRKLSYKPPIIEVDRTSVEQAVVDADSRFQIVTGLMPDPREIELAKVLLTENGGTRVLNPRSALTENRELFREVARFSDWTFMNRFEAAAFLRRPPDQLVLKDLQRFLNLGLKLAIVTLDKDGAMMVADDGQELHILSHNHGKVVDATGAGDCFLSFFVASIMRGCDKEEALRRAAVAAGIKVTRLGSANVPSWQEVLEAEKNYKV